MLISYDQILIFSSSSYTDSERNGPESNHQVHPRPELTTFTSHCVSRRFVRFIICSFPFTHETRDTEHLGYSHNHLWSILLS